MLVMLAALQLLVVGAQPALHVPVDADGALPCAANKALRGAIALRLPSVKLGAGRPGPEDLLASLGKIGTVWWFEVKRSSGAVAMSRALMTESDCPQLADTAALILERYLADIDWRGRPMGIELTPAPAPVARPEPLPPLPEAAATPSGSGSAGTPSVSGERRTDPPGVATRSGTVTGTQSAPGARSPEASGSATLGGTSAGTRRPSGERSTDSSGAFGGAGTRSPADRSTDSSGAALPTGGGTRRPSAERSPDSSGAFGGAGTRSTPADRSTDSSGAATPTGAGPRSASGERSPEPTLGGPGAATLSGTGSGGTRIVPGASGLESGTVSLGTSGPTGSPPSPGVAAPAVEAPSVTKEAPLALSPAGRGRQGAARVFSQFSLSVGGGGWFAIPTDAAGALSVEVAAMLLERVRLSLLFAGGTALTRDLESRGSMRVQSFVGLLTATLCAGGRFSGCGGIAGGLQLTTGAIATTPPTGQRLYQASAQLLPLAVLGLYGRLALALFGPLELSVDLAALFPLGSGRFSIEGFSTPAWTTAPVELIAGLRLGWKFY